MYDTISFINDYRNAITFMRSKCGGIPYNDKTMNYREIWDQRFKFLLPIVRLNKYAHCTMYALCFDFNNFVWSKILS